MTSKKNKLPNPNPWITKWVKNVEQKNDTPNVVPAIDVTRVDYKTVKINSSLIEEWHIVFIWKVSQDERIQFYIKDYLSLNDYILHSIVNVTESQIPNNAQIMVHDINVPIQKKLTRWQQRTLVVYKDDEKQKNQIQAIRETFAQLIDFMEEEFKSKNIEDPIIKECLDEAIKKCESANMWVIKFICK